MSAEEAAPDVRLVLKDVVWRRPEQPDKDEWRSTRATMQDKWIDVESFKWRNGLDSITGNYKNWPIKTMDKKLWTSDDGEAWVRHARRRNWTDWETMKTQDKEPSMAAEINCDPDEGWKRMTLWRAALDKCGRTGMETWLWKWSTRLVGGAGKTNKTKDMETHLGTALDNHGKQLFEGKDYNVCTEGKMKLGRILEGAYCHGGKTLEDRTDYLMKRLKKVHGWYKEYAVKTWPDLVPGPMLRKLAN